MPKQFGNKCVVSHATRNMSFLFNSDCLVGRRREGSIAISVFIDFLQISFYKFVYIF